MKVSKSKSAKKNVKTTKKNAAKKTKATRKPSAAIQQKQFVVKSGSHAITFDVLLIGDVSVYDDKALKALNPKAARYVESALDALIAEHLGAAEMEHVLTAK